MLEFHFKADGPTEELIVSALNLILDKVAEVSSAAASEKAEVVAALGSLTATIDALTSKLNSSEAVPVETILSALDGLKSEINGIYTPEVPTEPIVAPADPETATDPVE